MKSRKTFRLILLLLIMVIAFLTIRNTYSKYITQTENSSKLNISNWNIKLNNKNIQDNADFSEDVTIVYEENEHIADGVIVPTSKGTFSLNLESTGTELPYKYEISLGTPKPYTCTLNSSTISDDGLTYFYDISISLTNQISDLSNWTLSFEVPDYLIKEACTIQDYDTYTIEDNKLAITSADTFSLDETKIFNMTLATQKEINFQINNVTLNDTNFDYFTDKISDFRITSYFLNGSEYLVPSSEASVTGTVTPPTDITQPVIHEFVFTVEWYDGLDNVLDNFEDVEVSKGSVPSTLPVTLKVTQLESTT